MTTVGRHDATSVTAARDVAGEGPMASECDSPSALAGSPHQRRKFDAAYKLRIVREAECGGVGQVLQREGLSSACLCLWRKQRAAGELAGLSPGRRGRPSNGGTLEFARMKRENQSLRKRLKMAETTIEVQRKVCRNRSGPRRAQTA